MNNAFFLSIIYLICAANIKSIKPAMCLTSEYESMAKISFSNGKTYSIAHVMPPQAMDQSVRNYHKFVNLATRAIFKNDFLLASSCYDSAFEYRNAPYYEDIKSCILVNYKAGLFDKNTGKIKMLFKLKQIDSTFLFTELPPNVFDDKNIKLVNNLLHKKKQLDKKKKPNALPQLLREMFIIDQKAHTFEGFRTTDSLSWSKAFKHRDSIDHENLIKFIGIHQKFGFPTEEKVGLTYDKDRSWTLVIRVLLLHFIGRGDTTDTKLALGLVKSEFFKGNIHPFIYASLLDNLHGPIAAQKPEYNFMSTTIVLVDSLPYRPFVFYNDSLMREVNTNRISIGLDSFHIAQKQLVCSEFGAKKLKNAHIVGMSQYAMQEIESYAFVKYAFEQAKLDMKTYKINSEKILKECNCQDKLY